MSRAMRAPAATSRATSVLKRLRRPRAADRTVGRRPMWMPHSVLSNPCQRPERGSSPSSTGRVQYVQPEAGVVLVVERVVGHVVLDDVRPHIASVQPQRVDLDSPNGSSHSTIFVSRRVADWSRRRPEIQAACLRAHGGSARPCAARSTGPGCSARAPRRASPPAPPASASTCTRPAGCRTLR